MILLDTNILVRLANAKDVDYKTTHSAIAGCRKNGKQLFIANQSLHEFWVVATRPPHKNGMGMSTVKVDQYVGRFLRVFTPLTDPDQLFSEWRNLVNAHGITGLRAYDVRLAAIVKTFGLWGLMTYNLADFKDLPVRLVDPKDRSTW